MRNSSYLFNGKEIPVVTCHTAVVGSGAAGLSCALRLKESGVDVALVTEGMNLGISRNTGSDKQTYYKLSLCGDAEDCPAKMAEDLFSGGCTDGDNALCEAALSAKGFLKLCELGVPFPTNEFGEYVGYKTDHDKRARATSAGPLTSKMMTEALEAAVKKADVAVFDSKRAISIIKSKDGSRTVGFLTLNLNRKTEGRFTLFCCENVVFATGGPVSLYRDTVYPTNSRSGFGVAAAAGVTLKNLTEWQFGLASTCPRWNVSGTYMQVLPRLFSMDELGNEYDLLEMLPLTRYEAMSMLFKKGYEWPFDCKKAHNGSSVIDLLVYRETALRGRRVFLNFRQNPFLLEEIEFEKLSDEAYDYINNTKATQETPIDRLIHMNEPAYQLYLDKGVDLKVEPLEIALSAQHHNGGIEVDNHWQTDLKGFFVIGEAAGTHGIARPGGSALNAGQAGAIRAADTIATSDSDPVLESEFLQCAVEVLEQNEKLCDTVLTQSEHTLSAAEISGLMSENAGALRNPQLLQKALDEISEKLKNVALLADAKEERDLVSLYHLLDVLTGAVCVLSAMEELSDRKISRGSSICHDEKGSLPLGLEEELFRFSIGDTDCGRVQQVKYQNGSCTITYREVRPLPKGGGVFETVWKEYREKYNL